MPVRWTVDHARELFEVVGEGPAQPADMHAILDAMEKENAVSYRKLIDARKIVAAFDGRNFGPLIARLAAFENPGPFAFVVPTGGPADGVSRLFLLVSDLESRGRIFRDIEEARAWLMTRPTGKPATP